MKDIGDTFDKPKPFRDRKKTTKKPPPLEQQELHHPQHKPYERGPRNWKNSITTDGLGEDFDDE